MNDSGQITGYYFDSSSTTHSFVYSNGTYTTIDDPLGTATTAVAINDSGQIVGTFSDNNAPTCLSIATAPTRLSMVPSVRPCHR
jgi:probable HAF family extracellular repeat protein